jgi:hypothetical protein
VSLGGGLALPIVFGLGAFATPNAEARVNLTARTGVSLVTHFAPPDDGLAGLYIVGIHQTLGKVNRKWSPFLTVGLVGGFSYRKVRTTTRTIKETGDTLIYPSHTGEISKPLSVSAGAGVRRAFARHLAAEFAAQVIPYQKVVTIVFTGNVIMSIGRGR